MSDLKLEVDQPKYCFEVSKFGFLLLSIPLYSLLSFTPDFPGSQLMVKPFFISNQLCLPSISYLRSYLSQPNEMLVGDYTLKVDQ
ncbi:hypothetical protein FGO68_gene16179 [Halteria grandinella]|uniref:Uncharacterized protein n=1 Tax=Halteria grandinella TaxID=5974 RepID=A0A8J8T800_HALGN|nr:hypothetical protein FGO68_gene16179 [Halteria grandinella]